MNQRFIYSLFATIVACLVILGCSEGDQNLSREKAEQAIKKQFNLPYKEIRNVILYDGKFMTEAINSDKVLQLEREGLLRGAYRTTPYSPRLIVERAELTEKSLEYLPEGYPADASKITVITSHLAFGSITGIIQSKDLIRAQVEYTLIRTNVTPYGRIVFNQSEQTIQREIAFTKYDDGWRIDE